MPKACESAPLPGEAGTFKLPGMGAGSGNLNCIDDAASSYIKWKAFNY